MDGSSFPSFSYQVCFCQPEVFQKCKLDKKKAKISTLRSNIFNWKKVLDLLIFSSVVLMTTIIRPINSSVALFISEIEKKKLKFWLSNDHHLCDICQSNIAQVPMYRNVSDDTYCSKGSEGNHMYLLAPVAFRSACFGSQGRQTIPQNVA